MDENRLVSALDTLGRREVTQCLETEWPKPLALQQENRLLLAMRKQGFGQNIPAASALRGRQVTAPTVLHLPLDVDFAHSFVLHF